MSTRSITLAGITLLAALVIGQGCPTAAPPAEPGDTTAQDGTDGTNSNGTNGASTQISDVEIDDFVFEPKSVTIQAGETVRWTNRDFTPHAIRSGDPEDPDKGDLFTSGSLGIGHSFQYTFGTPGTYKYHCQYHYSQVEGRDGVVIVKAAP